MSGDDQAATGEDGELADIEYGEEQLEDGVASRELRRSYHDRIAEVRERSLEIVRCSVSCTGAAARVLSGRGSDASGAGCSLSEMRALAASVDSEVVSLLALESPMARDLRVILASRDVTQIGLLCVGLCAALAPRVQGAAAALGSDLSDLIGRVACDTERLMAEAESAWAALDDGLATSLEWSAQRARALQTEFLTSLVAMVGVPMEASIDLAMVARALERLVDHSVEIAERVLFVVNGTSAPPPEL